ncbi:MAG: type II toxin-antitoxin system PemK/MazF family toxin [Saccharopolyspora sp.]|uniref:type II toxin-antitoxin system PemK/MazF family toxin n=1 Tax=Saccharopolyspora sp. TaxID=33915 RepID=UPI0025E9F927|nr:type II toxin-antitoxin system PemK/MazF family toxin [Saccharopolyspora sp.]MBQ6642162.1 type II toxin-antitoxin system PemK/MazF family toxin [Saccharopolyspora sp.]
MRRGEIFWVELEPVRASEANKTRPAVVVSNDAANRSIQRLGRGVVTVVPVTSNISRVLPFQVLLRATECGLDNDSKAQAEQLRAVSYTRIRSRIGALPRKSLEALDAALRRHLNL